MTRMPSKPSWWRTASSHPQPYPSRRYIGPNVFGPYGLVHKPISGEMLHPPPTSEAGTGCPMPALDAAPRDPYILRLRFWFWFWLGFWF